MSRHQKGKRRDEEVFSGNEFYRCDEFKMNKAERFLVSEGIPKPERFDTKEENGPKQTEIHQENKDAVAEEIKAKATKQQPKGPRFQDRVVESTGPIRTIVSAATCTVAVATAATTVFLVNPPQPANVVLVSGNDYVQYELNLSQLDKDSSYQLIVTNPSFNHTEDIDVEKADALEFLKGYVYGLKPNSKYDFRLMRQNGEIGGYSEFYTKSFFTQKAPDPTALFHFRLDEDVLTYDIQLSDYYKVCSNTYLQMESNGLLSDKISITDTIYSGDLTNVDNSDILFRLYSTIDGEEKMLSEYEYQFNDFSVVLLDDGVTINGHVGDEFRYLSTCQMEFTANYLNNETKTETKTVENVADIQQSFTLPNDFVSYRLRLYVKDYDIYDSGEVVVDQSPTYTFGSQELSYSGLKVLCEGLTTDSSGTIQTDDGNQIPLEIHDGYFVIPLRDSLGNRYSYNIYSLVIDGKTYEINPDTTLLYVDTPQIYQFNGKYYLHSLGYTSLNPNMKSLGVDILDGTETLATLYVGDKEMMSEITMPPNLSPNSYSLSYYPVDQDKQTIGQGDTIQGLTLTDRIDLQMSVTSGVLSLTFTSTETYEVKLSYYASDGTLLKSLTPELTDQNQHTYDETLSEDVSSVTYDIIKDGKSLFTSDSLETINLTQTGQNLDKDKLVLDVEGAKADMEGTIMDADGESHDLTFEEGKIILPLYNEYGLHLNYNSYEMTITNSFATTTFTPQIETALQIDDVMLANTTNDNGVYFKAYYVLAQGVTDYQVSIDAYEGDTLSVSDTVGSNFLLTLDNTALDNYNTANNASVDTRLVFKMTNANNMALTEEQTFTITSATKTMSDTSGTFDGCNPGDVLQTYNDDGTINFYIVMNFVNTDPDVFVRVYVGDQAYDTREQVLEVKDLPADKTYGLRFRLLKAVSGSSPYCFEDLLPSGSLNEERSYYFTTNIGEDDVGAKYIEIDVSDYANPAFDPSKCSFDGHPDYTYDPTTHIFRVPVSDTEETLTMHFYGATYYHGDQSDSLQTILDEIQQKSPSMTIQGNMGHDTEVSFSLI